MGHSIYDLNKHEEKAATELASKNKGNEEFLAGCIVGLQNESRRWESKAEELEEQLNLKAELEAKDKEIERLQTEVDRLTQNLLAKESTAELREEIGV